MLELRQITKDYSSGGETVHALRGIDLAFRENEFVSILGQSGCGKTTLLNLIGGLDRYTSGDLVINGKSTREYRDRDWDTYRNHSVGFVFQSYNLIPHQNVLSNVELALTLSGVSRTERKRRAKEALERVGLGDQLHKMPNQMSGGQMQRVAIARALVNNPDILLADEPTGALDSETSVQVMEILKEVARDRLVIMVTHNPDLAQQYSTRIIRLLDGTVVSDTMPFSPMEETAAKPPESGKKPSMSFFTAMALSFNNLMTKKGRTFLTAFAGSIGIIGIALILSLSSGAQNYIDRMEEDILTAYPITIQQTTMDMTSMMGTMLGAKKEETHEAGQIYSSSVMTKIIDSMMQKISTNDLSSFKTYLEEDGNTISGLCSDIQYTYPTEIGIYTTNQTGALQRVNPVSVLDDIGMGEIAGSMGMNNISICTELPSSESSREGNFELLSGAWPESYNEVVLIVDKNYEITDYSLYALGLLDTAALKDTLTEAEADIAKNGTLTEDVDIAQTDTTYSYEDLMKLDLRLVLPTDYYEAQTDGTYADMREDSNYMTKLVTGAEQLHVVGIVRSTADSGNEYGAVGYTEALTEHVIAGVDASDVLRAQKADPDTDIFNGLPFADTSEDAANATDTSAMTAEQETLVAQTVAALPAEYQSQISGLDPSEQAKMLISYGLLTQADYDALGDGAAHTVSDSTYEENLDVLHAASLSEPSSISLYADSFEGKKAITDALDAYNDEKTAAGEDDQIIQYTDYVGTLMSSVTNIVDMVSYVLIAFVGISLVVSSIMIGVITLISVQERTKEIGILRSIGASKRDISRVFNAETLVIGFGAGIIGVGVTVLLNIPINLIIKHLAGVGDVSQLPLLGGVVLVVISVLLTLLAGLIPAKTAARKDPVEALRTE